jgi:predicted MPP superfamily phosphohydrolase
MFHTIITLSYVIPNFYVFLRIGQLFVNKGYKLLYTMIYLLIALIYPFASLFSSGNPGFVIGFLAMIAGYMLPFYLYLFLSLLFFDIFLLVNRMAKIVSTDKMKRTKFKIAAVSVVLFCSLGVVIAGAINLNTIRTSEYRIEIPRKSAKIDHLKIAFVADFHLKQGVDIRFVEQFAKKIADVQPDLLLFGGDIVEGDRNDGDFTAFEKIFSRIKAKYGLYSVLGNHEYYGGRDRGRFFNKSGIKLLRDSNVVIDNSFNLLGRLDSHFMRRKSLEGMMKPVNDSLPVILLDHRPTEIDQVSKTNVDVQLSGHTHDGQMFPLNLILRGIYHLTWGYEKIGNTHFFVTSGIRLWGPPVRTVGKSEIMVIEVDFK